MKHYIKLPAIKPLPDSRIQLRVMSDDFWKQRIFFFLLKYYKEVNQKEIVILIDTENKKNRAKIENAITKHIYWWLKKDCPLFGYDDFKINREASAEGSLDGFYDLKIQRSEWQKYFCFECKNLGEAKNISAERSINEYVYVRKNGKENGGMYRYFNGKYACDINFGGMIGFVIGEMENPVAVLINKIEAVYNNQSVGKLMGDKIIKNSVFDNANTFDSIHLRQNCETNQDEVFYLHHLIMDFT